MVLSSSPIFAKASPGIDPEQAAAPIDGSISLLIAAGVLDGTKKINDKRNKYYHLIK